MSRKINPGTMCIFPVVLVALVLSGVPADGQQLPFPRGAFERPALLEDAMARLAEGVIPVYKAHPPESAREYFSYLLRYELVRRNYPAALACIDSLRASYAVGDSVHAATDAFPFWAFARTELARAETGRPFAPLFDSLVTSAYTTLSDRATEGLEVFFRTDLAMRQAGFLRSAARLKSSGTDAISYADARNLCFAYVNFLVYGAELPRARPLLQSLLAQRFFIEDSVLIPMRDGARISATIVRSRKAPHTTRH